MSHLQHDHQRIHDKRANRNRSRSNDRQDDGLCNWPQPIPLEHLIHDCEFRRRWGYDRDEEMMPRRSPTFDHWNELQQADGNGAHEMAADLHSAEDVDGHCERKHDSHYGRMYNDRRSSNNAHSGRFHPYANRDDPQSQRQGDQSYYSSRHPFQLSQSVHVHSRTGSSSAGHPPVRPDSTRPVRRAFDVPKVPFASFFPPSISDAPISNEPSRRHINLGSTFGNVFVCRSPALETNATYALQHALQLHGEGVMVSHGKQRVTIIATTTARTKVALPEGKDAELLIPNVDLNEVASAEAMANVTQDMLDEVARRLEYSELKARAVQVELYDFMDLKDTKAPQTFSVGLHKFCEEKDVLLQDVFVCLVPTIPVDVCLRIPPRAKGLKHSLVPVDGLHVQAVLIPPQAVANAMVKYSKKACPSRGTFAILKIFCQRILDIAGM